MAGIALSRRKSSDTTLSSRNEDETETEGTTDVQHKNADTYSAMERRVLTLLVGGDRHDVQLGTLLRYPATTLGEIAQQLMDRTHSWPRNSTLKFDRSARVFIGIIDFYRSGHLCAIAPLFSQCTALLSEELLFWKIDLIKLPKCCRSRIPIKTVKHTEHALYSLATSALDMFAVVNTTPMDAIAIQPENRKLSTIPEDEAETNPHKGWRSNCTWIRIRQKTWDILENPQTSIWAKACAVVSIGFILVSVAGLIVSSLPEFKVWDARSKTHDPTYELQMVEMVCNIWFTVEYLLRLLTTPNRSAFVRTPLAIIDVLAVLPFYMEILTEAFDVKDMELVDNVKAALKQIRMLRILRAARILKVARYSDSMQAMGQAIRQSFSELMLASLFLGIMTLLFASFLYFAENEHPRTNLTSIPSAAWFSIVTMTTVGYGDTLPITTTGKFIGALAACTGLVLLAFPVMVMVSNFEDVYYDKKNKKEKK